MKLKYLFIAAIAGVSLVGCQREAGLTPEDQLEQNGEANYMGFSISMPAATKGPTSSADGFEYGTDEENEIKTIHFFFYKDGAYVSSGFGDVSGDFTVNPSTTTPAINVEETLDDNGTAQGVVVLESTMTEPNQVLCVINSYDPTFYKNKSLAQVLNALHTGEAESVTKKDADTQKDFVNADGGFVMLTSPMYGYDKSGKWEVKFVNDIFVEKGSDGKFTAKSHIQSDKSKAKQHPVEIYVERMAARAEINNLDAVTEDVAGEKLFKASVYGPEMLKAGVPIWDIKPLAWSLTATNKKGYAIKHVEKTWYPDPTAAIPSPYTGWLLSGDLAFNPVYNYTYDPSATPAQSQTDAYKMKTRVNWAMDPYYGDSEERDIFPHSARELLTTSAHVYYSATQIDDNYTAGNYDAGDILQRYCYENTFDKIGQEDPRIAGTMLLLYAQGKKKGATAYSDIFSYMSIIDDYDEYATMLLSVAFTNKKLYKLDGGAYKPLTKDDLQIVKAAKFGDVYSKNKASFADCENKKSVIHFVPGSTTEYAELKDVYGGYVIDLSSSVVIPGETNLTQLPQMDAKTWYPVGDKSIEKSYSDGYVTLVPKATLFTNSPYAATKVNELYVENPAHATDPTADEYIKATEAEVAEVFLGSVFDIANRYVDGKMYYAIPIEHLGKEKTTVDPIVPLEGNYGMVRNNLYRVNIGKINGLGHGIHDVDEPIVPGDRKEPYYLAAKINILSWQIVGQTADLQE